MFSMRSRVHLKILRFDKLWAIDMAWLLNTQTDNKYYLVI